MGKQVGIAVDTSDGQVIIEFDRKVRYLKMTATQAVEFAMAIAEKSLSLNPNAAQKTDSGIILPGLMN